eukprot:COSAG06_NODE_611_length_13818_cov_9.629346_9_plen_466_part_01
MLAMLLREQPPHRNNSQRSEAIPHHHHHHQQPTTRKASRTYTSHHLRQRRRQGFQDIHLSPPTATPTTSGIPSASTMSSIEQQDLEVAPESEPEPQPEPIWSPSARVATSSDEGGASPAVSPPADGPAPLDAFLVVEPPPSSCFREGEDLKLGRGDIVILVGPAPFDARDGHSGWRLGYKLNHAHEVRAFPTALDGMRQLSPSDISSLSSGQVDALIKTDAAKLCPLATIGTFVPRVEVARFEVTGVVQRRDWKSKTVPPRLPNGALPADAVRKVAWYTVRCTGSDGQVWTVERRYSQFAALCKELTRARVLQPARGAIPSGCRPVVLPFPPKAPGLDGPRLHQARIEQLRTWLQQVSSNIKLWGKRLSSEEDHQYPRQTLTHHANAVLHLRRFLQPSQPLCRVRVKTKTEVTVFGDTDATATAAFVAEKLGMPAAEASQLACLIAAGLTPAPEREQQQQQQQQQA